MDHRTLASTQPTRTEYLPVSSRHAETKCGGDTPKWLEPVPDWEVAEKRWGLWWEMHSYIFATAFLFLSLATVTKLLVTQRTGRLKPIPTFLRRRSVGAARRTSLAASPVLGLLVIFGLSRSFGLYIDPYGCRCRLAPELGRAVFTLGTTSLLATFQVLFYALVLALRVRLPSFRWLQPRVIVGVLLFFFIFNIAIDLLLLTVMEEKGLLALCMIINLLWGLLICLQFLYLFVRLHQRNHARFKIINKNGESLPYHRNTPSTNSDQSGGCDSSEKLEKFSRTEIARTLNWRRTSSNLSIFGAQRRTSTPDAQVDVKAVHSPVKGKHHKSKSEGQKSQERALRFTATSAVWGLLLMGFMLFMLVDLLRPKAGESPSPDPWTWYGVQTSLRIIELFMACCLLSAVFSSSRCHHRQTYGRPAMRSPEMEETQTKKQSTTHKYLQTNGGAVTMTTEDIPSPRTDTRIELNQLEYLTDF